MTTLSDFLRARPRFSRSANIERDHGAQAIEGYTPTGRAIDVISRVAGGLADSAAGRTFSITGPHGGGKSSLAVFLDGLLSAGSAQEHKTSHAILRSIEPSVDVSLIAGIRSVGGLRRGFVRAFATAQTEPVSATIARALYAGAMRDLGQDQTAVPKSFAGRGTHPTADEIRESIQRICSIRPLILVIDEFGKNLEFYASAGDRGDPFLLQELAETTQGEGALPFVLLTMQHLSFDDYVQQSSTSRRREWSKVQGRFQDIPFVETPAQARRLIASALERTAEGIDAAASKWIGRNRRTLESLGLRDLADDAADAMPLHPLSLAVLPDLCARYGQNERTLFSFLAGSEPLAFPQFLKTTPWKTSEQLPLLGIDKLYDYFLESSGNMIGVADSASRWVEIETRIRDTAGLTPAQLRTIKTIGVLNLVSGGGRVRASRAMIEFALATGEHGTRTTAQVGQVLASLVDTGLLVYRAFSDEYRIWQGSDYDLRRVIENARRECEENWDLAALLNDVAPLEPAVAGRHSQRNGVLRFFIQKFSNLEGDGTCVSDGPWDGAVLYSTSPNADAARSLDASDGKPIVVIAPDDLSAIRDAALDAASLRSALRSAEEEGADWVARRELVERSAVAQQQLHGLIERTWCSEAQWDLVGSEAELHPERGLSAVLSDVADRAYTATPRVANEMIARRELTSQGAKARRFLMDAMLAKPETECFGIDGYGPEKAMYEAIFRSTGIHRQDANGHWGLQAPTDRRWKSVWRIMNSVFDEATTARRNLVEVTAQLTSPPVGLKEGVIPLLMVASLVVHRDEVALYEHGSLILALDDAVAERLTRNPAHFTVKNTRTQSGQRRIVVDALVARLGISGGSGETTFLNVATALFKELRALPPYSQKTKRSLSSEAIAVRDAFHTASEPDVLIFETLPGIVGLQAFAATGRRDRAQAERYASRLADTVLELRGAYPALLREVHERLAEATSTSGTLSELRDRLAGQAAGLEGRVLEPRLKAFVGSLTRPMDDRAWLENVAMVVSEGQTPRVWTDDIAARFSLRIAEVGGALRRTLALLYERLASDPEQRGFSISRMTLTRPDGSESIELLAITDQERVSIDEHFEPFLDKLADVWGSRSAACRMLMARLAAEHDADASSVAPGKGREDVQYG